MERWSQVEPRSDAKVLSLLPPLTTHTSFFLALLSSQEPKIPSYFLTKVCFITNHLVPFHTELAQASVPCWLSHCQFP